MGTSVSPWVVDSGGEYATLCRDITAEMGACSLEVIAVEEALKVRRCRLTL
jgi:hypothetical protein